MEQNTLYAMLAEDYGEVSNDAGATVYLQGAGYMAYPPAKERRSMPETSTDGFIPTLDDANNIIDKITGRPRNYI